MAKQNDYSNLKEGVSIFDENGQFLGPVERVSNDSFYFNGQSYPFTSISRYDSKGVYLSTTGGVGHSVGTNEEMVLPVVEEEIAVGKREVERGGVRITSQVTEQPVEAQVKLHEEHVKIDRQTVNRPVTDADLTAFKEGVIEVTETAEEPVVSKQARVVEEVRVGKQATDRTETVRDTVKKTEVEVQEFDGVATNQTVSEDTKHKHKH